jgi:nucleoside-diphosphate-sugar epimerase
VRVVVTGATGNVGTGVLAALAEEPGVESVVGVARRLPALNVPKVEWRAADVATDDLVPLLRGADAVVHLVWIIQPSHDEAALWRVNVAGSIRVFEAAAEAKVPVVLYESSFGAYSPGPKDAAVDESWPTHGVPTSAYSRQKAYVERVLDAFEVSNPQVRVARFRSALVLKRAAGPQALRLYGGRLVPRSLLRPDNVAMVPDVAGLRIQAVHSDDVGEAYRLALLSDVSGSFNLASTPVLDPPTIASSLGARTVPIAARGLRAAVSLSWLLRLQPTSPEWVDLVLDPPLLDVTRARTELGWEPAHSAIDALHEFLTGVGEGGGAPTPPLHDGR